MKNRTLRLLYALVIVGMLAWPIPHYFLSRSIESDPWKNFGMAMYATYFDVGVVVRYRKGERWVPLPRNRQTVKMIDAFVEARRSRGKLLEPVDLAHALQMFTNAEEIQIEIRHRQLDGAQGLIRPTYQRVYEYRF